MAICGRKTCICYNTSDFPFQNMSLWSSKDLSKQYSKEKSVLQIMRNSQVGAEKLGKTANFVISLIFSTLMLLDRMFLNIFTNHLLCRITSCIEATFDTHISTYKKKF